MDFDDAVLRRHYGVRKAWFSSFRQSSQGICSLAGHFRGNDECFLKSWHCGSFNISVRLHWEDGGPDWLIRFPIPGKSMWPDEKVRNEVAVMEFIQQKTNIPVPSIIGYGMAAENPTDLGPFIIMAFVEGRKMSEIMKANTACEEDDDILDPNIEDSTLRNLYGQMADILLELFEHDFDHIGSLSIDSTNNSWSITHRPLTLDMNEISRCSGLSEDDFPAKIYDSSADYLSQLSELHFNHLLRQRNSVFDAADCREKYTRRYLFEALIPRFVCRKENAGPFKLFCDDLCPGNMLVDDSLRVVAVVDWEFCYTAPAQFSSSPPWWLLLKKPTDWLAEEGPEDFLEHYAPKLDIFLQMMESREATRATSPLDYRLGRLSARMRQSFDDKTFWFNMAARTSFGIDDVYWYMLDEHCYGPRTSIQQRVEKATGGVGMYADREIFVRQKTKQLQEYKVQMGCEDLVSYGDPENSERHDRDLDSKDDLEDVEVYQSTFIVISKNDIC
jgi:Phosphotransferase enzyme family